MTNAVRTPVARRAPILALLAAGAAVFAGTGVALADMAPIDHDGYLEYQFRISRNDDGVGSDQHLATWRTRASTFVWRPYILQLDGSLGLTQTDNSNSQQGSKGTIITGGLAASRRDAGERRDL